MPEVKWIKIVTDIFDDEKILLIESMPDADSMIVIWFKLLCLAGKQNNSGVFIMSNGVPYTEPMLATIFRRKETVVSLALRTFEQFSMIEILDDIITIPKWGKHQNLDKIESKNEYQRQYMQKYRARQKQLAEDNKSRKTNGETNSRANVSSLDKSKKRLEEDVEYTSCFEVSSDANPQRSKIILTLTLNDKTEYPIYEEQVNKWADLYPAVDVIQQLRNMEGWLDANPGKRKTKKGILRFVNAWLSREQNRGGHSSEPEKAYGGMII